MYESHYLSVVNKLHCIGLMTLQLTYGCCSTVQSSQAGSHTIRPQGCTPHHSHTSISLHMLFPRSRQDILGKGEVEYGSSCKASSMSQSLLVPSTHCNNVRSLCSIPVWHLFPVHPGSQSHDPSCAEHVPLLLQSHDIKHSCPHRPCGQTKHIET